LIYTAGIMQENYFNMKITQETLFFSQTSCYKCEGHSIADIFQGWTWWLCIFLAVELYRLFSKYHLKVC